MTSPYSIEDYLEMESNNLTKHEYWNGKIWEMAGGSDVHNEICARIIILSETTYLGLTFIQIPQHQV